MRAAAYGGAYAAQAEADRGTIETGKLADLVVLSHDPFQAKLAELLEIKVETVIHSGKIVRQEDR